MDPYTRETKTWLDKRFLFGDEQGVYWAHQPIYGFRNGPIEPGIISRYIITFEIMSMLAHLNFTSLLDVGGAEGYKAHLISKIFNVNATNSDLSLEACKRSQEIFGVTSVPADIHELPFHDNAFDVLLCSETLEHVSDVEAATDELLRVAKKAVVISVPHDSEKQVALNKENREIHGHIHYFYDERFDYLHAQGYTVIKKKIVSPLLTMPTALIDGMPRTHNPLWKHPKIFTSIYNCMIPFCRKCFGQKSAELFMYLDRFMCKIVPLSKAYIFLILKEKDCFYHEPVRSVTARQIIGASVKPHYLKIPHRSSDA